jgi:mRNA interferase RelE/StbE
MASFELRFKRSVATDLRTIPGKDTRKILKRIKALAENPRSEGCIKLTGKEYYRVRAGNYRVVYEIRDAELIILVIRIAHRRKVYD